MIKVQKSKLIKIIHDDRRRQTDDRQTTDRRQTDDRQIHLRSKTHGCELITNIALLSPLIRSPPTDINTLYTAITRTKYVTRQVCGPNQMTVVTFNLQLYDIAMKLWMKQLGNYLYLDQESFK